MGWVAIGWWLVPLVLLGLVVLAVRTIWVSLTVPRRVTAPSCERCRYPVAGLSSFECPECGTDLRRTGIVTRPMEMRRRGGMFVAILSWTYLVGASTLMIEGLIATSMAWSAASGAVAAASVQTSVMTPNSGAYATVTLEQTSSWNGATPTSQIDMTLEASDGAQHTLRVDSVGNLWEVADEAGAVVASGQDFGDEAIAALYESAGLDASEEQVAAEARELVRVVDIAFVASWTTPLQMNLKEFTVGQPTWSTPAASAVPTVSSALETEVLMLGVAGAAGIIYIVGLVWGVLRRGKLMTPPREAAFISRTSPPAAPPPPPPLYGEGSRVRGGQPLGPLEWTDDASAESTVAEPPDPDQAN